MTSSAITGNMIGLSYATGTATAAFTTSAGSATINTSVRTITWAKIGRVVFLSGRLDMSSVSTPSGTLKITGLPFPAAVDSTISVGFVINRSFYSLTQNIYGKVLSGESSITIEDFQDGDAANGGSAVIAGSSFILGGSYFAL